MSDADDRWFTAVAQAWLGSVAGMSRIQENVFRAVLEPAKAEEHVAVPFAQDVNLWSEQGTRIGCSELVNVAAEESIPPEEIGVFPMAIRAKTTTCVTFSVHPDTAHPPGLYTGHVTDGNGTALLTPASGNTKPDRFPVNLVILQLPKTKPPV